MSEIVTNSEFSTIRTLRPAQGIAYPGAWRNRPEPLSECSAGVAQLESEGCGGISSWRFSGEITMSTMYRYTLPVEQTNWKFDGKSETCFTWEYDDSRAALLQLYDKGKKQQWDAAERIDWSLDLDPENPMMLDDRVIPIFGAEV